MHLLEFKYIAVSFRNRSD